MTTTSKNELVIHPASPGLFESYLIDDFWGYTDKIVQKHGGEDFIVTLTDRLTYKQTHHLANLICAEIWGGTKLHKNGIGVYLKSPLEVIPSMLGILKSGNYIIPFDTSFPASTVISMIETAEVKAILTNHEYVNQIRHITNNSVQIVNLDEIKLKQAGEPAQYRFQLEDIAQILFTSGSTGKPKGVIEDYRYLIRAIASRVAWSFYGLEDRHLQVSNFTFSGTHIRMFTALMSGSSLYYYDLKEDGMAGLPDWIRKNRITFYNSTPSVFRSFVGLLGPDDIFPTVTKFSGGGEKKLTSDIEAIRCRFPNVKKIHLGFGSTETQNVTSSDYPIDYDFNNGVLPSGKPNRGMKVYIQDEAGRNLEPGEEGEIVVYGDAMARGYINNPELTRKRFIPDPLNPGWQYFKTGDLGKILPDGQLVHLGRVDNMVKVRGIRIEVDAIENIILSHRGVTEVASRAIENQAGKKRLASYFVPEHGIDIPISDLRKRLAEKLPKHLLPHYLIQLNEMPKIPGTGKINVAQLPLPNMNRPNLSNPFIPPATDLENKLLKIWEEEIGVTGIGVTDDFFDVGGDSLIGVLVFVHIERNLGKKLPVSILLTASTIRKQAELIEELDQLPPAPIISIRATGSHIPLFFIPGQGAFPTRVRILGKKLGSETPVYAMQHLDPSNHVSPSDYIAHVASIHINEIRKHFPRGPYILVGESSGGKIAYEMAQQFLKLGESVPLLALLDTYLKNNEYEFAQKISLGWYWMLFKKHLSILIESDFQGKLDYLRFYKENGWKKIRRFFWERSKKKPVSRAESSAIVDTALPESIRALEKTNRDGSRLYAPLPYPGHVVLFKALRSSKGKLTANGWDDVKVGELSIHELDCYHGSILFDPAVSRLTSILQSYIDRLPMERNRHHEDLI